MKYLRVADIVRPKGVLPIARSTWLSWVQTGRAPKGTKLSRGVTVWRFDDVVALAEAR
jgi:prophage regulatory protein